jgi:1,2-diacylglycerol-3-alpha-glucose alpha-1,2-glucosyltransferase
VVSNGVDRELFRFSPEKRARYRAAFGLRRFTVFGAGNIIPRKGIIDFLEVAERLPQYDFIWYGHRWPRALAFHPQMEKRLEEKPSNVRLPGFVEDPSGMYAAGDVLLFPSLTETQGLVILEAASLGRPVIVRDLPEYVDWLYHGKNCLKGRSVEEFCEQITCLAEDRALYQHLAQGAERLAEAHSLAVVGRRLVTLYRSVLEQPARPDRRKPIVEPSFKSLANLHDDFRRHPGL